jgi:hypothetical protein
MSQAQELEAFDRYIARTKPNTVRVQKLLQDWKTWYSSLTWFDKNLGPNTIEKANAFRSALVSAVYGNGSEMGAETKASGSYTKKGTQVPDPPGYRRAKNTEITPTVQGFAVAALNNFAKVSKTKGEAASIGMRYSGVVGGKQFLSQCEWHFDNHPKGGKGDPFWHMGSSIFVPTAPVSAPANSPHNPTFRTEDQSLASLSKNNPYA